MAKMPNQQPPSLLTAILLFILIVETKAALAKITPNNPAINVVTSYSWAITFDNAGPYHPLILTFPSQLLFSGTPVVSISGTNLTASILNATNQISITSSLTASVTLVVSNIRNPSSAISTVSFSYQNSNDGIVYLPNLFNTQVTYLTGSLSSCPWTFSLCTEQPNSNLFIPFTTINPVPAGNNYFLIGFFSTWTNHFSKGLIPASTTTLPCSYSTNGGSTYTSGSCNINGLTIEFSFSSALIPPGSNIVLRVGGVNAPPTMQTTTSGDYSVYTADSNKAKIDGLTYCFINNVYVTNQTSATLTNNTLIINRNYGNPNLKFPITPFTITMQKFDTIDVSYSPISSLMACSKLTVYRNTAGTPITMASPASGTNTITFTFPSAFGYNTEYTDPIYAYLECTGFLLPPSQTPTSLSFTFKRNGDTYMQLSTPIAALATNFNPTKAKLNLSNPALVSSSTYTFNFMTGQALGNTPALVLTFTSFTSDFTINSPACTVTIISLSVSGPLCTYNNVTNVLFVNFTASNTIPANSNITLTVNVAKNPSVPNSYPISMETYYIGSDLSSKVQSSSSAFTAIVTEISNHPATLTPTGLTVYTPTLMVLSFVPIVNIPPSSTFSIQFPSGVSLISVNSDLLKNGGTALPVGSLGASSTIVSFVAGTQITAGSAITITISLTTPSNQGTYSYVKLIVSNSGTNYLSNTASLYLNVNAVKSMTVSITPNTPTAGATSSYLFTMFLTIPHGTSFIVQVDVPSDTKYLTSGSTCTNCNASTMSPTVSSFSFVANNSGGTASSYSFTISSFTNPRAVGNSSLWGIATKTVSPTNLISYSYAFATIVTPNTLTKAELSNTDSYFRNNTNNVNMTLGFYNKLSTGDYIMVTFTSYSYTASTVYCSSMYGSCGIFGNASNVIVVKIIPNITSIINNTLIIILEGLTSNPTTLYGVTSTITVSTFNSSGAHMDSGSILYNISCGLVPSNECKQCYFDNSCINCYSGYFLRSTTCVSACGVATSYLSYSNSTTGTCVTCINSCYQCYSDTLCKSCVNNYYLYLTDSTCRITCPTSNGYYALNGQCGLCPSNCLECRNSSSNSCSRCSSNTSLMMGFCQNGCGSTNYYQLNGQCLPCHASCYNCSGAGSGSCYLCNVNYHKYLTICVSSCPTGTAVNPSTGSCGCDTPCLTCSTYTACTNCLNSSLWVLNGGCVESCPLSTYANAGQCVPCSAGCLVCTINTCTNCVNSSYLFNNTCYSDCNLISQQYDVFGTSCVLCPTGCDHCEGTNCTACLDGYSLNSTLCIKACLLTNTCELNQRILPLPGVLSLAVWVAISAIIHLLYHKNYLPYSIVLFSGVIQFILILALISSVKVPSSRLLATDTGYLGQMRGLLVGAIVANYLQNMAYLAIFLCYIRPLITNARQIDTISNVVVLVIAIATNFRFGLVAFARMFPKPNIFIPDPSKLTPVHYLCLGSLAIDLLSVVACGLGLIYSQKLSNSFMLSLDLIIVIAVNIAMTIWFVAVKKPDEYFEDTVKKYHAEEGHTRTEETLPNEKNFSKANMVGNESFNFDDFDKTENDDGSFNKFTQNKVTPNGQNIIDDDTIKENPLPITVLAKHKKKGDPSDDPNFQNNLKSKKSTIVDSKMKISKASLGNTISKEGKSLDDNISPRKNYVPTNNFNKGPVKSERKVEPQKNIAEVEESDYPQMQQNQDKGQSKVFNRQAKPKKVKQQKPKGNDQPKVKGQSRTRPKDVQQPMKIMKKGDKKIGYFQSDAYESNADGEDIEQIIKQKIWQSTIKLQKPSLSSGVESQTGHEQISPSWFNIQNQRLEITDLEEADPE